MGSPVTYTAKVSPVPNSGTVKFTDGGTAISGCSAQSVNTTTGEATCETTYGSAGVHTITAEYSGSTDTVYAPSTSSSETVVATTATTTALSASSNAPAIGSPVTYTATVSPAPNSGTVKFTDGGTTISGCSAQTVNTTTGKATCEVTYGTAGIHKIVAEYSGSTDTSYQSSVSATKEITATASTTTTLTASSNSPAINTPVTYTATISPVPNSGTVAFTDNGTTISQCSAQTVNTSTGKATCEVTYGAPGVHKIVAEYSGSTDTSYQSSISGSEEIIAITSTTTTLTASSNSPAINTPVTYTATVSPVPNGGTVAFTDEGAPLPGCSAQPVNTTTGEAVCEVTYETPDVYVVVAEYSGSTDTSYQSSVSASKEVVATVPTTTTLTASTNSPTIGSPVTYTAIVSPVPSSGTVSFLEGETVIPGCGEQPVSPITGEATCEVTYETAGAHSVAAQFSGSHNALYAASTTASLAEITASAVTPPSAKTEPTSARPTTTPTTTTTTSPTSNAPGPKLRLLKVGRRG